MKLPGWIRNNALLAFAALASWGLVKFLIPDAGTVTEAPQRGSDYFSRGYTRKIMDEQGQLEELLVAKTVNHQSHDNTTRLSEPVLTLYKKDSPPWKIRSEYGIVPADSDSVFLGGKVFIDREGAPGLRPIKLITRDLTVKPDDNLAETKAHVDIFSPPHKVSGNGMRVTLKEPITLSLYSNVRGRYELP